MKRIKNHIAPRLTLTLMFTLVVLCILAVSLGIVGALSYLMIHNGWISTHSGMRVAFFLSVFIFASLLVGTIVAAVASRIPLQPIRVLINGMNRLANGEFQTRIDLHGGEMGKDLSESFNTLAAELQNTEMFRSDFVNNFSHEFKTPIVSILGFAKLLNRGSVPPEQQKEYLTIIEEEAQRLSILATRVLDLTRVENQSILTDITRFNVSEQIRNCVLLLEKQWTQKQLELELDMEDHMISGNEELLKQVWINLLDNGIKFSPQGGRLEIAVHRDRDGILFKARNFGQKISEQDIKRIFRKFYQGDNSHSSEGTGIGLAIVKRIVDLHKGRVNAYNEDTAVVFTVWLPDLPQSGQAGESQS